MKKLFPFVLLLFAFQTWAQNFSGKYVIGEVAGMYSRVQLWNPPGSGKTILIDSLEAIQGLTGSDIVFYFTQTPMSTDEGYWQSTMAGQAHGVGNIRAEISTTSAIPATQSLSIYDVYLTPSAMWAKRWASPLTIPQGWGLNAESNVKNAAMAVNFEGREQ